MITLITGAPGLGKTSMAVAMLEQYADRQVYVDGIKDLIVKHEPAGDIASWYEWLPEGAVLVIDECQNYFRPTGVGSRIGEHITRLETHRHSGNDLIIITQAPQLIHSNVRRLVGRHLHIRHTMLGRYSYEWTECGDYESKTSRSMAIRTRYKPARKTFGLYKSASVHMKPKFKRSLMPLGVAALGLSILVGGAYVYSNVRGTIERGSVAGVHGEVLGVQDAVRVNETMGYNFRSAQFVPLPFEREYTAPAYSDIVKVSDYPKVAACLVMGERCACYSQQGTRLYSVTKSECVSMANAPFFDPFAKSESDKEAAPGAAQPRGAANL